MDAEHGERDGGVGRESGVQRLREECVRLEGRQGSMSRKRPVIGSIVNPTGSFIHALTAVTNTAEASPEIATPTPHSK
jgi:hypothetical protein